MTQIHFKRSRGMTWRALGLGLVLLPGLLGCSPHPSPLESLPPERALPRIPIQGGVWREAAHLWYGVIGSGPPVILLHGGLSSHRAWGRQVPALLDAGYQVILIDSRGHGRSTLGSTPLSYDQLAEDVGAVIDHLQLNRPAIIGWSDGAITALVLGMDRGDQLGPIYAFGANMDLQGVRKDAGDAPILRQVGPRLAADYAELSPAPDFSGLTRAVRTMQTTRLHYGPGQLALIRAPQVLIVAGSEDEFITPQHAAYIADAIPGASLQYLADSGHFAPWQSPELFNQSMIRFLKSAGYAPDTAETEPAAPDGMDARTMARGDALPQAASVCLPAAVQCRSPAEPAGSRPGRSAAPLQHSAPHPTPKAQCGPGWMIPLPLRPVRHRGAKPRHGAEEGCRFVNDGADLCI